MKLFIYNLSASFIKISMMSFVYLIIPCKLKKSPE